VEHVLRCSGLLHMEASQTRVFQSEIKTDGSTTMGDTRGTITDVLDIFLVSFHIS
jgi:hypothetical protein